MPDIQNLCFNCFNANPNNPGACPYCGYDNNENRAKYPIALKAGSILNGQYIVGRVLGQGGFGITYLALDYRLNIKVAIKEYVPDGMATRLPETTLVTVYAGEKKDNFHYGAERFLDEARILARFIGNKNITAVKCFFEENNTVYFVMDYVEGISFKNYIKNRGGRVDYTDTLRVLIPVMDALSVVHREGLIHRDVTPDNIYITKDNEIKLLDFGSARYSLGDKSKSLDVILKAGYAPKEQYIRRGKQGTYTDVYSLSACFYASITGFLPPEALERMEEDEIVPISAHGIRIPDCLEAAIMKGLAVRAEDRWQNMEDFKAAMFDEVASEEDQNETEVSSVIAGSSPFVISEPQVTIEAPTEVTPMSPNNEALDYLCTGNGISTATETSEAAGKSKATGKSKAAGINSENNQHRKAESTKSQKNKSNSNKNKVAAVISAAACILLIISLIVLVNNRDGYSSTSGDNSVAAADSENTTEASQIVIDTLSKGEVTLADEIEADKAAEDKAAADKAAADKAAADKAAADKAAADKAAADKAAADKAAADKAAADKAAADKAAADKAAADKAAADKAAADKAAADKAAADKAAADKAAADKAAADKAAADKAAAKKAAADKAAAEKVAAEKAAAEKAAECPYCDGTGKVECTWCEGTGICMETHQEDDGEYIYEGDPCLKKLTCDWCDGTGKR